MNIVSRNPTLRDDLVAELCEQERIPLRLLAEGHTVKSAANLLDVTPSAINERLREARKKTGIGSSRELARHLKAQENCDTKIGLVANGNNPASNSWAIKRPSWFRKRILIMLILVASITLGVYNLGPQQARTQTSEPSASKSFNDPMLGEAILQFDMAGAHAKVRSEPRDAQWAPQAEELLREEFERIPLLGGSDNPLRIKCATTLCEVAGIIDAPLSDKKSRNPENSPLNKTILEIQSNRVYNYFKANNLNALGVTFGATKSNQEMFFFYFQRAAQK